MCGNVDYQDGASFSRNLAVRLWVHWCLKAVGTMLFMALFFTMYLYLLKNPYFTVIHIAPIFVDNWIGFKPNYLYFYLSLWVYVSLVPALMKNRKELIYYGIYIGAVCLIGVGFYILFPTSVPQYAIDLHQYPQFSLLKTIDTAGNAFPSLHVATAFFSAFWFDYLLIQMKGNIGIRMMSAVWCLGIIYSTMAIKQHLFMDVIGGLILGGILAVLSLRYHKGNFYISESL